ncbi:hypothetical protein Tco_1362055 [Tanacetum coccineum]
MTSPKFTATHNMIAFLEKPAESDGFHEIIDFLSSNQIHYALIVNLVIYTSCIEQFSATVKEKMVNGERQIQALIDKKKVIVTEASIRSDLHLEDACGIDCLPTATIFEEPARMGYEKPSQKLTFYKAFLSSQWKFLIHTITQCFSAKTTAWNKFSSTMASAIICFATNQKFNMSKYVFDAMVKHLEGGVKILLYPRFVQVFINQQLRDMSHHKKTYLNPSLTKKIFANMKRDGKDFSRRVTPLFATMMVQPNQEEGGDSNIPTETEVLSPTNETPIEESVPTSSNDSPQSDEDSFQLNELMIFCTSLQEQVLDLQAANDAQAKEITSLKNRVKKLEGRRRKRSSSLRRLRKVGMRAKVVSSDDEGLVAQEDASKQGMSDDGEMLFDMDADLHVKEVIVDEAQKVVEEVVEVITTARNEEAVSTAPQVTISPITSVELTLAQTLVEIRSATKPKAKSISIQEPSEATTTTTIPVQPLSKDKRKAILVEPERPMKRKAQIQVDKELAQRLFAEEKAQLEKEQNEARSIAEWDNIQATIDADRQLAEQLQAQEREESSIKERSKLLAELIEERRKFFAAKRAKAKRNKPPTKAQQRKMMCSYLKNMAGYKMQDLKHFDDGAIKEKFDKAFTRTNKFVHMEKEVEKEPAEQESSTKRAGDDLEQEGAKKQRKVDDIKDTELLQLIDLTPDPEEPVIDVMPLASKTPIIGWKILKEGKKNMFEPNHEDVVWRRQDGHNVLEWRLYESCGVHFIRMQSCQFYMLVEKKYPLTVPTLNMMLKKTLRDDHQTKMVYQLLKLTLKQIPGAYEAEKKEDFKNK